MNDETNRSRFVVCIENTSYPASLDVGKVYPVLPATPGEAGFLRVIDESGEDYLYPARYFVAVELPDVAVQALRKAA